jgi:hypothetical protein
VSWRTGATLQSSLLKISPWGPYVTPTHRIQSHPGMHPAPTG